MTLPLRHGSCRWIALFFTLCLLAGCSAQRIRDSAQAKALSGDYEAAVTELTQGLEKYPESAVIRAGLLSTRAEAHARLLAQAAQKRAEGRVADASKLIQRALELEPGNDRLRSLLADLDQEEKQRVTVDEAKAHLTAGRYEQALSAIEGGLRSHPRNSELLAMQRKILSETPMAYGSRRSLEERRPISLDFRATPLSVVLDAITRSSGVNFILDRDVRLDSRVTVFLRSAPVQDAIELVTASHQLARRIVDAKTVLIYPNTPEKQKEHQEQVIRAFKLGSADAKATAAMLRSMLRVRDPFVDERANMIVIRESPDIVALADRLVALHDQGEAEVMLDVEILEISRTSLTELGIAFPSSVALTPLAASGATGLTAETLRAINSGRIGVSIGNLLLNLQRQVGDANILANPSIRAKNREKARVMIGDRVPVVTTTTSSTGFISESISYLDVGLRLDVEPLVSPDDDVTIKLGLEVSTVAKEIRTSTGAIAYQLGTRNASTTLRLRDGETQLLAGLISNEERMTATRVPGLGDLPIAGRLFSSQKDNGQRTELVLAITPRILRPAGRMDAAQAELWVGPEGAMRLRAPPPPTHLPGARAAVEDVRHAAPGTGKAPVASESPPVQTTPSAATPTQVVLKAPGQVRLADVFVVELHLSSADILRGVTLELAYPPAQLEPVEVIEGPYFRQNDGVTSFTHSVNPVTGRLGVGLLRNTSQGATGAAQLVAIKFKAKTEGTVGLSLPVLNLIGNLTNPVSRGTSSVSVAIQ